MASRVNRARQSAGRNRIRFAPESHTDLLTGIETLERILGPTIGPNGHPVVFSKIGRPGSLPERLLDGATIARRMTGLDDTFANVGMMLARQAAWTARGAGGDSPALAVTIMAEAVRQASRMAAYGENRSMIRRGIDREIPRILAELERHARPASQAERASIATELARDPAVSEVASRAIDSVGPDAVVLVEESRGRALDLELITGSLWETSAVIGPMQSEGRDGYAWLDTPRVLIWDAPLDNIHEFAFALDRLRSEGVQRLVVMARSFSREILGLLALNTLGDFAVVPVELPHEGSEQVAALGDIAVIVKASILRPEANDQLSQASVDSCGNADRIVVGRRMLNIQADTATPECLARQATVRDALAECDDENDSQRLLVRLGRLSGEMAVVWVGAPTLTDRAERVANVRRTLAGLRQIGQSGIVNCLGATLTTISRSGCTEPAEDDIGARIARAALQCPAAWLARNAGYAPGTVAVERQSIDSGSGSWDTVAPASVIREAVRIGLSAASLAVSSDVVIHKPRSLEQADLRP